MDLKIEGNTVTFWVRVKPRSSRERLGLDSAAELRLELHAAPTEGEANAACVEFFARLLRLPRSGIEILAGERSRRKLIRIRGGEEIASQLKSAVATASGAGQKQLTTDN